MFFAGLFRKAPAAPTTKQLQRQTDDIQSVAPLQKGSIGAITAQSHPSTVNALAKVESHRGPAAFDELNEFRKNLAGNPLNKPDKRLTNQIRRKVDKFTASTIPASTKQGTGTQANEALKQANALFRRKEKSAALDEITAKIQNSKVYKSGRKSEAIESQLRSVLNSKKKRRQFSKAELARMREIVEGTKTKNLAGKVTRFNPLEKGLFISYVCGRLYRFSSLRVKMDI